MSMVKRAGNRRHRMSLYTYPSKPYVLIIRRDRERMIQRAEYAMGMRVLVSEEVLLIPV